MKCWFIENPVTKDLVKSIVIRMSPGCEKEFIIVMKAPSDRPVFNLTSFLSLKLADGDRKRKAHLEKRLKSADDFEAIDMDIISVDLLPKEEELRVMLIGRLENPRLKCMRELRHSETECNVIPLGVKISQTQQKFRIPFKNLSLAQDADFDFTFVKTPASESAEEDDEEDLSSNFEFYCQPGNMKIPASQ